MEILFDPSTWIAVTVVGLALSYRLREWRTGTGSSHSSRTAVIEGMSDGVIVVDMDDRLLDVNRAARIILSLRETGPHRRPIAEALSHHSDLIELFRGAIDGHSELALETGEGETRIYDLQLTALLDHDAQICSRVMILRDISDRVMAREDLARESTNVELLQHVAVAANDAASIPDALSECLELICKAMRWSIGHVLFPELAHPIDLVSAKLWYFDQADQYTDLKTQLEATRRTTDDGLAGTAYSTKRPAHGGEHALTKDFGRGLALDSKQPDAGVCFPVIVGNDSFAVFEFANVNGERVDEHLLEVLGHLGSLIGRAIERKLDAEKIRRLAFRDSLTQLPNRESFHDSLDAAVALAGRTDATMGLLFIDLDGFKRVNDKLGHSAGDDLLREVARRFSSAVRQSDQLGRISPEDTDIEACDTDRPLARLGGDEFTVLLNKIGRPEDAARVAERLLESLTEPIRIDDHDFMIGASIGIANYPDDGNTAETLLQNADAAMYFAKGRGRNCYQFYTQTMNASSARRLMIEENLRGALDRGEFSLRFQPLRDAMTSQIDAAEALLRWEDPVHGFIGPDEFIPIAEETGLIVRLGKWVLREACTQAQAWCDEGFRPIRIAVNLSGRQIRANNLLNAIEEILEETGLSPQLLELEITESTIMQDDELTTETLNRLDEMGIGLALDDFGTGYSSINYLRHFPIRRLKIDRSFVSDLMIDPDAAALTGAIIAMAHSLRVKVVGEGVESEEQATFLRSRGCEELQGYLISRPVDAQEFRRFLVREKDDDAGAAKAPAS